MKFSALRCHKKRNRKKHLHRITGVIAVNSKLFSNLVPRVLSHWDYAANLLCDKHVSKISLLLFT